MKFALIALAGLASVASAQSADIFNGPRNSAKPSGYNGQGLGSRGGDVTCLWDNGGFETQPGLSVLQGTDTIFGYGNQAALSNSMGDDFTVSGGGWNISNMEFYNYQTGMTTGTSTFTAVNWTIYAGAIGNTSTVMGSGSGLAASVWSGVYRVTSTTLTNTQRPIFRNTVNVGLTLPDGQYWVAWNVAGTLASGPWAVPVTPAPSGANAQQQIGVAGTWTVTANGGHADDMAFCVNGEVVPAPASLALMGLGGLIAGRRRR